MSRGLVGMSRLPKERTLPSGRMFDRFERDVRQSSSDVVEAPETYGGKEAFRNGIQPSRESFQ
jgi:hypothetical protein